MSEIRRVMDVEVNIKALFDSPTIQALAEIVTKDTGVVRPKVKGMVRKEQGDVLSFAQQRLWFIDQLQEGSPEYNMPAAFLLSGHFNVGAAQQSLSTIIERHEVLRTTYLEKDGEGFQQVNALDSYRINCVDLTHLTNSDSENELARLHKLEENYCFDLTQDVMLRCTYIKLGKERGALLFNVHHIASDGWSIELLINEFTTLYRAIVTDEPVSLTPLPAQYADYALWQRQWLQGKVLAEQADYWRTQLADMPLEHGLRLDNPRAQIKGSKGASHSHTLSATVSQGLATLAAEYQITPFMLVHGALSLVLSRHSSSDDIVIGTPVANRLQSDIESLIGFFVNTLVLRVDTTARSLGEYLSHVREVHLGAQSHQDIPFEQLVELLQVPRSRAYTPLFQIMLTMQSDYGVGHGQTLSLPDVSLSRLPSTQVKSRFDMEVDVHQDSDGMQLLWTWDSSLFDKAHVEQLTEHFARLLTQLSTLSAEACVSLSDLELLSREEHHYLLNTLNQTAADYPREACIHTLFEHSVEKYSDNVALEF
ncbi:condensation domain-containing protein, partial [Pseudoalteromonas luteoviolacea]|uniref:condensation domain-containing protein n=1 Tax=Pseudoalteromonas luteoviolacea TaxID=43657 RepID=UPI001F2F5A09